MWVSPYVFYRRACSSKRKEALDAADVAGHANLSPSHHSFRLQFIHQKPISAGRAPTPRDMNCRELLKAENLEYVLR
jgi:hypothetical protein